MNFSGKSKKVIVIVPMPNSLLLDLAGPNDVFTIASSILSTEFPSIYGYELIIAAPTEIIRCSRVPERQKSYYQFSGI